MYCADTTLDQLFYLDDGWWTIEVFSKYQFCYRDQDLNVLSPDQDQDFFRLSSS